jgi:hypothetical protein
MDDAIEVTGLAPLLDDDETLPYLDLQLRAAGRCFQVAVLVADEEWTVNVRDERGKSCPGSGDLYPTQADAFLAAMLIVLDITRRRIP